MVESEGVPGKGRIPAITEKLSGRVPERGRISVSTEKWQNSSEYRENVEFVRLSKNCTDEYHKMIDSM